MCVYVRCTRVTSFTRKITRNWDCGIFPLCTWVACTRASARQKEISSENGESVDFPVCKVYRLNKSDEFLVCSTLFVEFTLKWMHRQSSLTQSKSFWPLLFILFCWQWHFQCVIWNAICQRYSAFFASRKNLSAIKSHLSIYFTAKSVHIQHPNCSAHALLLRV